jgi:hypothetical protein
MSRIPITNWVAKHLVLAEEQSEAMRLLIFSSFPWQTAPLSDNSFQF